MTDSITGTFKHLMEAHFSGSKVAKESWKRDNIRKFKTTDPSCHISDKFKGVVTKDLVKAAFRQFGSLKAAGPDEIKPIVLKNLPDITLDKITSIYQASLQLGYMPQSERRQGQHGP